MIVSGLGIGLVGFGRNCLSLLITVVWLVGFPVLCLVFSLVFGIKTFIICGRRPLEEQRHVVNVEWRHVENEEQIHVVNEEQCHVVNAEGRHVVNEEQHHVVPKEGAATLCKSETGGEGK